MKTVVVTIGVLSVLSVSHAQFHQKKGNGSASINKAAVQSANQMGRGTGVNGGGPQSGQRFGNLGQNPFSTMYMTTEQRQRFSMYNANLGQQKEGNVDLWYRAIHHEDNTFTETLSNVGDKTVEQQTKSKNGVLLLKRIVSLGEYDQPKEVLIYDGRDRLKYRGVMLYDNRGRFREEHLFDTDEKLLRRKVQEYDEKGNRLPQRMWDYAENIPSDLRLVITETSEELALRKDEEEKSKKKLGGGKLNLFGGKKQAAAPTQAQQRTVARPAAPAFAAPPSAPQAQPVKEAAAPQPVRKGLKLPRLFGGNKK